MTSAQRRVPGALREDLLAELARHPGWGVRGLARKTGWSPSAVRRELNALEQLGLAWSWKAGRALSWALAGPVTPLTSPERGSQS